VNILAEGVDIIIATPARLDDFVMDGEIYLSSVTYLVLVDADHMLRLRLKRPIRKTLSGIRPDRQIVMTSATWSPSVQRFAQSYVKNCFRVFTGPQKIEIVEEKDKDALLLESIKNMGPDDKGNEAPCDDIPSELSLSGIQYQSIHGNRIQYLSGIQYQSIHGNRNQYDREQALEVHPSPGSSRHVLYNDFPHNIEDNVHRVDRTGSAGSTGAFMTLVTVYAWVPAMELNSTVVAGIQELQRQLRKIVNWFSVWKQKKVADRLNK
jgi:superfamily II DNA/RNA helicase